MSKVEDFSAKIYKALTDDYRADLDGMDLANLEKELRRVESEVDDLESWQEALAAEINHRRVPNGL